MIEWGVKLFTPQNCHLKTVSVNCIHREWLEVGLLENLTPSERYLFIPFFEDETANESDKKSHKKTTGLI